MKHPHQFMCGCVVCVWYGVDERAENQSRECRLCGVMMLRLEKAKPEINSLGSSGKPKEEARLDNH